MGGPGSFIEQIETLFDGGVIGEDTDRRLLERFTGRDRAAAELAFAVLVKRHGPMVYRACRAVLRDPYEAEDAFQATFFVLARKAKGLWIRDSLGPWLLSVARRTAGCARTAASRRRARERTAAVLATAAADDPGWDDHAAVLHEELGRLPEKYRTAVLLCDLEGLTQEQAARRLGWPDGTVRSRLARGRERLRERLTRRGISPAVVSAARAPTLDATSVSVAEPIIRAAVELASGRSAAGMPASALSLMKGALQVMFWSKFKLTAAVALAGALLCSTGFLGYRAMGRQPAAPSVEGRAKRVGSEPQSVVGEPVDVESSEVVAIGKARIEVAKDMLDTALRLYQAGEVGFVNYLAAQKRYDEVVADVTVRTDADRIRFLDRQVATLKQMQDHALALQKQARGTHLEVVAAKLARLDAEYALAKVKAKVAAEDRRRKPAQNVPE